MAGRRVVRALVLSAMVSLLAIPAGSSGTTATPKQSGSTLRTSWPQFRFSAQHTGFNPYEDVLGAGNVSQLQLLWKHKLGRSSGSSPAAANGLVYGLDFDDSRLLGLDAAAGSWRWGQALGCCTGASPAVVGGVAYVAWGSGGPKPLVAYDAATGAVRWKADVTDEIADSPTVAHGTVYVGTAHGKLLAFDATTGAPRWETPLSIAQIGSSTPAVAIRRVYIGSAFGSLDAFDATTGTRLWSASLLADNVASSYPPGNVTTPAVANGIVYVGANDWPPAGAVYALDGRTGRVRWTTLGTSVRGPFQAAPAVADGIVYAASGPENHVLYALDAATGAVRWTATADDYLAGSPTVANGVVYQSAYDGFLYAFDAGTADLLWTSPAADRAGGSSPIVANGIVYLTSQNGYLLAYGLPH